MTPIEAAAKAYCKAVERGVPSGWSVALSDAEDIVRAFLEASELYELSMDDDAPKDYDYAVEVSHDEGDQSFVGWGFLVRKVSP